MLRRITYVTYMFQPWEENTLHTNVLKPTLQREQNTWSKRNADMNLWTRPNPVFGTDEPATIHRAGQKLKEEKLDALRHDQNIWTSKVLVENTQMSFHRCAPDTEMKETGFNSSNQLDRLTGVLKDPARKLALRQSAIKEIPPLNVVLNPSVDTAANKEGQVIVQKYSDTEARVRGFAPGPYMEHSWLLERNKIPIQDYQHSSFIKHKGHDFK